MIRNLKKKKKSYLKECKTQKFVNMYIRNKINHNLFTR